LREGGPGETLFLSDISETIGLAAGHIKHKIVSPIIDQVGATNKIWRRGAVTYNDY
jgi:uncharacterized phage protein gp47/JayE